MRFGRLPIELNPGKMYDVPLEHHNPRVEGFLTFGTRSRRWRGFMPVCRRCIRSRTKGGARDTTPGIARAYAGSIQDL